MDNEGIDRLSDLPDAVLGKILSYLPTKNAVASCILSTRWKNVFPFSVPPITLTLDDSLLLHPNENHSSSSFIAFVDRLFDETLLDVPCVDELKLKCDRECGGDAKIISWLSAALRLKVQRLDLKVPPLNVSKALFGGLHGCTTLKILRLAISMRLCVPVNFRLPKLEELYLSALTFDVKNSIGELIRGCPALEVLSINACSLGSLRDLNIRSHMLAELYIVNCWKESKCRLVLDTPYLQTLEFNGCAPSDCIVSNFKDLYSVDILVHPCQEQLDGVARVIAACSTTVYLLLAAHAIYALHIPSARLPVFQNLICLKLDGMNFYGWPVLARLLHNAPKLEHLIIDEREFHETGGSYADFESLVSTPPSCLSLNFKVLDLVPFKGEEDEFKLIKYFLETGQVLKMVRLHCQPFENDSLLRRLLSLPMTSKIVFQREDRENISLLDYSRSYYSGMLNSLPS